MAIHREELTGAELRGAVHAGEVGAHGVESIPLHGVEYTYFVTELRTMRA